jgi:glycosyltransferase involved in cell wall biosynthesis
MAAVLKGAGYDVAMFEEQGRRPDWFASDVPVVDGSTLGPRADQVLVYPEDQPILLAKTKEWPQRKIVYAQNQYYAVKGYGGTPGYDFFGVTHMLCSSRSIYDYARLRHPALESIVIPCGIDRALFRPLAKKPQIALMPRKRMTEIPYIADQFQCLCPHYQDWNWQVIGNKSEAETALMMGESSVFLSLSRLEGFGLTPLEAMAAGCVVAGFTGGGGREYASPENGFWAQEDDLDGCVQQLKLALDLASSGATARASYAQAAEKTLAAFTPELFRDATLKAFARILAA